jgi:rod shape-determining protein MreD
MDYPKRYKIEERIGYELRAILILFGMVVMQKIIVITWIGLAVNLVLLLVVLRVLLEPVTQVVRWALYGGLLLDVTSGARLGVHAIALIIAVGIVYVLLSRITSESWVLPIVAVLVGGIVYHLCNALLLVVQFGGYDFLAYLTAVALPEMLMIVIPALPIFLLLRWVRSIRRDELPLDVY